MVNLHNTEDNYALPEGVTPTNNTIGQAKSAYTIKTVPALINFYHITLGAPLIDTWLKGIRKEWFSSWPALTVERVRQYCTKKPQTPYGHQQMIRQGIKSTKVTPYVPPRSNVHEVGVYIANDINNTIAMNLPGSHQRLQSTLHLHKGLYG